MFQSSATVFFIWRLNDLGKGFDQKPQKRFFIEIANLCNMTPWVELLHTERCNVPYKHPRKNARGERTSR